MAAAAFVIVAALAAPQPAWSQSPAQTPAQTPPAVTPASPAPATTPAQPGDVFGESTALTAKTMIYVKGSGTWDKAFETITSSFKKIKVYLDKEGLKPDGLPMTIFTATDDAGFEYEAAIPIAEAPKNPPHGDILLGQSPEGQALKFVPVSYTHLKASSRSRSASTESIDDRRSRLSSGTCLRICLTSVPSLGAPGRSAP